MAWWRVVGASARANGKKYLKDQEFESHIDLDKLCPNAFIKVSEGMPVPAELPAGEKTMEQILTEQMTEPVVIVEDKGNDVTKSIKKAVKEKILVFKKDDLFFVYDSKFPDTLLNKEGVKSKKEVEGIITKYLG